MKNISTFQAALIGIFGIFILGGIFVMATYSGSGKDKQGIGKVVIWGTLPQQSFRTALSKITQQNQDFKDVSYIYKKPKTFNSTLTTAIASGNGPDIVLIPQTHIASLKNVVTLIPYSSFSKRNFLNAFADVSNIFLSSKGSYGIPLLINPLVLYYNRSLLSSASVAKPPSTWDELSGLVPLFTHKKSSGVFSQVLIPLGTYNNINDASGILSTLFLQVGIDIAKYTPEGNIQVSFQPSDAKANNLTGILPGESVLRFYTQFADPTKTTYTWSNTLKSSQQMFLAGNSTLYLGYASEAQFFTQANPNLSFDVAPIPQLAVSKIKTVYANVYALALPHGSKNINGALRAALMLSTNIPENIIAQDTGLAPALRSLLAKQPSNPIQSVIYSAAIMARTWLSPSTSATNHIFSTMINGINAGQFSISTALTQASQSITAILQ